MKNTPRITAIHISVIDAFFDSGFLNAGMPFEIASTPVSAAQPDANARRMRNHPKPCAPGATTDSGSGAVRLGSIATRANPATISTRNATINMYVGIAKIVPDSRKPRRFSSVINITSTTAISTLNGCRSGSAEVIANTPAATDTETVRM